MAASPRQIAVALQRANVCSGKQADIIARELGATEDEPGEPLVAVLESQADPHAPLHESVAALWERISALEAEAARRKPGPKPKAASAS